MQGFDHRGLHVHRRPRHALVAACLAGALVVSGCSGFDGVELQGGVFDALGMSGSEKPKLADTKVEARPGLVIPPSSDKLPDPVTGSLTPAPDGEAWPKDAEDRKMQSRAELEKRQAAFCERATTEQRMRGETGPIMGPAGRCYPGLLGSFTKNL